MMTDDLFSGKAAAKAANPPADGLAPKPKGRLREQFHEVARFQHWLHFGDDVREIVSPPAKD